VSPVNIAKSLSAFANHYGGWIFYGIEEATDGTHQAGAFPGIESSTAPKMVDRIAVASKDSVHPSVYYQHKLISGPCAEIGLLDDKSVIVVMVPSGQDAPYVHSSGRIYRRIADSSDPKPETDRAILDQLWQRRRQAEVTLKELVTTRPLLSQGEELTSYMDLFLLPDPLRAAHQRTTLTFDEFIEAMRQKPLSGFQAPFDNFFTMAGGFVCRQIGSNNPYNLCLTWRHFVRGFSHISIPLSVTPVFIMERNFQSSYKWSADFCNALRKARLPETTDIVDVNQVAKIVIAIINQQRQLMSLGNIEGPLYAKARIQNVWRRVPFVDSKSYLDVIGELGIPIIQYDEAYVPAGLNLENMELLATEHLDSYDDVVARQIVDAAPLFGALLNAFGLHSERLVNDLMQLILPFQSEGYE
ncbi:MAG TPA: ATP-binding protein, partial [Anaerolineae bacterium]|nr:ATP-binding protein [Anaerolineae bacterium]